MRGFCFCSSRLRRRIMSGFNPASAVRELRRIVSCGVSRLFRGLLELQARFVFFQEGAEIVGDSEQAIPLFVIECDREAPEAVDADASFFTDAKFERAAAFWASGFFFQFGDAG